MSTKTIQNIAGISTLVCGTLHTTAHIVMSFLPSPNPEIEQAMVSVKINLMAILRDLVARGGADTEAARGAEQA